MKQEKGTDGYRLLKSAKELAYDNAAAFSIFKSPHIFYDFDVLRFGKWKDV